MAGNSFYRYQPLDVDLDQFRLLRVESSLNADGGISCQMEVFPRNDCPEYEALSYVWGPVEPARIILVDGAPFTVRENLWIFLLLARAGDTEHAPQCHPELRIPLSNPPPHRVYTPRYLWIDQICIDQTSNAEKSDQVKHMSEVYEQAHRVVVWLGDTALHSSFIMTFLAMASDGRKETQLAIESDPQARDRWVADHFAWFEANGRDPKIVQKFLDLDYWTRLWTVQEFILGKDLVMIWGDRYLTWSDVEGNGIMLFEFSRHISGKGPNASQALAISNFFSHRSIAGYYAATPGLSVYRITLTEAMEKYSQRDCANPLDKIFAIQALLEEKYRIDVDYSMQPNELFWHVVSKLEHFYDKSIALLFELGVFMGVTGNEKALDDEWIRLPSKGVLSYNDPAEMFKDPGETRAQVLEWQRGRQAWRFELKPKR